MGGLELDVAGFYVFTDIGNLVVWAVSKHVWEDGWYIRDWMKKVMKS